MTEAVHAARDAQVGLLCLPELCVSGYACEDMFFSPGVQQQSLQTLLQLAGETKGIAVAVGVAAFLDSSLYNCAALLVDGELAGLVPKQFLPKDGIHYEPRWFHPWHAGDVSTLEIDGRDYPIGDLLFEVGGVRVGFEVCRDAWVAERPGARLAARGADVILNPSASHFAFGKQAVRERFVLEGSRAFCTAFVYCNVLGNEAGRAVYDGGTLIASLGLMRAAGPRLSFADWRLTTADVDIDDLRRARSHSFDMPRLAEEQRGALEWVGFSWPGLDTHVPSPPLGPPTEGWEAAPDHKQEEFARAVALAMFDYLRKSHAGGLVVSLSGGADSSAVAVLAYLMCRLAVEELGLEGFRERLSAIRGLADVSDAESVLRPILSCVYQSTKNSGDTTRNAAQTVADAIGAEFLEWSVDAIVDQYVAIGGEAAGREVDWQTDDVALQNIQARARGPAAWLLANLRGALLLATSNRSEAAVGYATMDGDTCGGLSPIAGIDKAFLLEWLVWMETTGPTGVGPLPELAAVTSQAPTAELRPPSEQQTDEGDLMPYPVLDAIERQAIRDKRLPVDAWRVVCGQFPSHTPEQLAVWVERFFRLWCRNQWKRERYAPSFHVDDENLDPKTWCRFPILSSGLEEELAELRAAAGAN